MFCFKVLALTRLIYNSCFLEGRLHLSAQHQACPPLPVHMRRGVLFPGNVQPGLSTHMMFGGASLDQSHGMLAVNLELLGLAGLPRFVQEAWLWVKARLCWLILVETYGKKNPHGIQ